MSSAANNAQVQLYTCSGGANQQWKPVHGTLDDPRFSTANGTRLIVYTCNGGRNQQGKLP